MTVCKCGMDCSEFIGQHAIPANAAFNCPGCDDQLIVDPIYGADDAPPDLIDAGRGDPVVHDARL